ncbi:MAG TPA: hypothetical protein VKQ71_06330, partial [Acidimicrobiales bacterium]|nr:hypothetical protein [Acidimicrobiales bacterium]
ELKTLLPDIYDDLLAAGAHDVDVRRKLPGPPQAGDIELQYLAVRRPLIEWALRRALGAEPTIECHAQRGVTGMDVVGGRITGVRTGDRRIQVDLAVDALGRRSPAAGWVAAATGKLEEPPETSDCGVIYYSRYYRQRPGFDLPDGPWLLSPRGDLGYIGYASFPGDNGAFAGLLAVPTGVAEWQGFKNPTVFEAAVAQIPALRAWIDPDGVDPITDVLPMAGLRNSIRRYEPQWLRGLVPIGDARCHTDPVLAHGLSFGLIHAGELTRCLREHDDDGDALGAFGAATETALRERYDLSTALDSERHRMWMGEPVDPTRRDGDYALFSMVAAGAAAMVDPDVFRVFVRRIGLLDSTAVLDQDLELQRRIERILAEQASSPRPAPGPRRDEMLTLVATAVL